MKFFCDTREYDTNVMVDLRIDNGEYLGNRVLGLFMTENSRRVFIRTSSIDSDVGEVWYEASRDQIAEFARVYRISELGALVDSWK